MKTHNHNLAIISLIAAAFLFAVVFAGGCKEEKPASETATETAKETQQEAAAKVVNDRCPMMGTKIDPEKVPANLTRTYKGQKVGFCCGGCPTAWDMLSDAEKDAKLAKVMPPKE